MSDSTIIELPPLPDPDIGMPGQIAFIRSDKLLQEWCRANVAHATAAKDTEIEALRAEVERLQAEIDNMWGMGVHSCHENCQRTACVLRRNNKRLAEALRWYVENDETNEGDTPLPDHNGLTWNEINEFWLDGKSRAIAVLHSHDQERKNG